MANTSKQKEMPKFFIHSNDPDQMGSQRWQGGIGTIVKSVFAPGMFSKESGKHALFRHLTIREEDGVEHNVRYLRGWFGNTEKEGKKRVGLNMYPSKDGLTIAGPSDKDFEDMLSEYAELAAGKVDNMIPTIPEDELSLYEGYYTISLEEIKVSNVDDKQFMACVKEKTLTDPADPNSSPFNFDERSDALCGHKFQWDLLDQQYTFTKKDGEKANDFKLLLPTHYFGLDEEWEAEHKANGKTKEKKANSKAEEELEQSETNESNEPEADEFENDVEGRIVAFLVKAKKPLTQRDISTHIANSFKDVDERKRAIGTVNMKWLVDDSRPWKFEDGKFQVV